MTNLDRAINNDILVVSKSLLPYLNIDRQKPMAVFIKLMELVYTINLFSNEASVRSMSRSQESGWEKSFLNDVKANLGDDKAYFVDVILKLAEAKDLLAKPEPSTSRPSQNTPEYHLHPLDSGTLEDAPFPDEKTAPSTPKSTPPPNTPPKSAGPSPEQIINGLSSMLDPNQAQLLKVIASMFNSGGNSGNHS
ncbi:MAG: hypothetical protein U0L26_06525 [Cellulosilyticum sp.]|nr:hypothetical protein [Cellulosilyticum sp.]MEE1072035.1 hypothetical protein [Cellulosilyticum sp.]